MAKQRTRRVSRITPKFKVGDVVLVIWRDAHTDDPWRGVDEVVTDPAMCATVGFFLRYANKAIVLAASADARGVDEGDVGSTWVIPIDNIKHAERLRDARSYV